MAQHGVMRWGKVRAEGIVCAAEFARELLPFEQFI
jgi:hypothetical protein